MNRKSLPTSGCEMQANGLPSVIAQVRRARHVPPAIAGSGGQTAHAGTNSDSSANTAHSTDAPLLRQLIDAVRARVRERERYLKEREVVTIIARSKAAMRKDVSLGLFVAPVKLSKKSTGWRESEVLGWIEATTILSRVPNPGFTMQEFVAAVMASRIPMR